MSKNALAAVSCACGIILCVFRSSAFVAIGVIAGLAAITAGIYLLYCCFAKRSCPAAAGIALAAAGLALAFLSAFFARFALFLGGILLIGTGAVFIPACRNALGVVLPFCAGCAILGLLVIFAPWLSAWLTVIAGVFFIGYSGIFLVFL